MIEGNITATIQLKTEGKKNVIGEVEKTWSDVSSVLGWLDYASGQNELATYNAKIQNTTHYFLCDFTRWKSAIQDAGVTSENARMVIDGEVYQILLIDDPMGMHEHMEIYLQYVGGGLGVSKC